MGKFNKSVSAVPGHSWSGSSRQAKLIAPTWARLWHFYILFCVRADVHDGFWLAPTIQILMVKKLEKDV